MSIESGQCYIRTAAYQTRGSEKTACRPDRGQGGGHAADLGMVSLWFGEEDHGLEECWKGVGRNRLETCSTTTTIEEKTPGH